MLKKFTSVLLLLLSYAPVFTQQPLAKEAWVGTGTIQTRINSAGPLISAFRVPNATGTNMKTAVREVSLWIGGVGPSGDLHLAIQHPDSTKSDFRGGFRKVPNSAGVWKVTKAEIEQHLLDFQDNGIVDHPISSIYAWPGRKNPFAVQYNGFAMDSLTDWLGAPFANLQWADQTYNPDQGDVPSFGQIGYYPDRQPDEMVYVPFHVKPGPSFFPTTKSFQVDCSALFYTYYCDDASFLDDAVYAYITLQSYATDRLDTAFVALKLDVDINNPKDDYMGCSPWGDLYFYDSDTTIFNAGKYSPVIGFNMINGVLDTFGRGAGVHNILPLHPLDSGLPYAILEPELGVEYYRYMTGSWKDGTPVTFGGSGYGGTELSKYVFTGTPGRPGEWSELEVGSKPGNRQALVSSGPTTFLSLGQNRMLFSLFRVSGETSLSNQLKTVKKNVVDQYLFYYGDFFPPEINPYDTLHCLLTSSTTHAAEPDLRMFPNPVNTELHVTASQQVIRDLLLFDICGRLAYTQAEPEESNHAILRLGALSSGMYILQGELTDGTRFTKRLLIQH